jgi:hypothetical protein
VPDEPRTVAAQQHGLEDRPEGPRYEIGPGGLCDRLGGGVCLLRRDPSLLDRKGCDISGRVHVGQPGDAPMLVDLDEAVRILRNACDCLGPEARHRDHTVGVHRALSEQKQTAIACSERVHAREDPDAALRQNIPYGVADLRPEDRQRPLFRCSDHDAVARDVVSLRPVGGEQRELVRGQAPDRAGRNCEHDAPDLA